MMDKLTLARRLTEERLKRGYTQKQVAEALGVSDKTYSKWETGVNEMTVDTLCRLAEVFGCSPAAFFSESGLTMRLRDELAAMPPEQAALCCHEWMGEMYMGLHQSYERHREKEAGKPTPRVLPPEAPETPQNGFAEYPGGMLFLRRLGRDANFTFLQMPSEEGCGWAEKEAEELVDFFSLLRHLRLLLPILESNSREERCLFTADYLASRGGCSIPEAEEALEELERRGFLCRLEAATGTGSGPLYSLGETRLLRAILTLAHSQLGNHRPAGKAEGGGAE